MKPKASRSAASQHPTPPHLEDPANPQESERGGYWAVIVARYGVLGAVVLCGLAFTLVSSSFFTTGNALAMLTTGAVDLLLAIGVTLTLRLGDLDLSFAAVMNLSAVVVAVAAAQHHAGLAESLALGIGVGVAVGIINAILVVSLGLNSFVATLGVMTALEGIAGGVTHYQIITGVPSTIVDFATDSIVGIPLGVYYGWVAVIVAWFVYEHTVFGRYLLVVGGNRRAATLTGIRTSRIRWTAYVLSGAIFGFAGVILVGVLGSGDPGLDTQYLLPALAAAFLGTTTIQPGRFNAFGTLIGAYLLIVLTSGLALLGISTWVSNFVNGVVLIAAILLARTSGGMRSDAGVL